MKIKLLLLSISALLLGVNAAAIEQVDGIYQIGSAEDMTAFAELVNAGESTANAVLTADIDWTAQSVMLASYAGTFNGQCHSLTLNITADDGANYAGFVRELNGGTIENLLLKGDVACSTLFAGSIAGHSLNNAVIRNVASEVNVSQIGNGNGGVAAFGGFVGHIQNTTIQNVIFAGTLKTAGNSTSGVTGWADGLTMTNCAVIADIEVGDATECYADIRGINLAIKNFYFKNLMNGTLSGGTQVTDEQIKSGELAYRLGDGWYQTLTVDAYPVPIQEGHKQVFASGEKTCNGKLKEGATFNNESENIRQDEHQYVDGICQVCGAADESIAKKDAEGYYQIGTAAQMIWYIEATKTDPQASARLVEDIDISEYNKMLGDGVGYAGVFDGQGHTLTINISAGDDGANYAGFVRELNGGTIENLLLKGDVACSTLFAGSIAGHSLNNAVIRNVASEVNVSQTGNGGVAAFGGFVGHIQNTTIQNVIFAGSIKTVGNSTSGVTGWADGLTMTNCAVIADIEVGDMAACFADSRGGNIVQENFYYKTPLGGVNYAATQVTDEQIKSGELAYMLNGSNDPAIWFQTIDVDEYPVPFSSHGIVLPIYNAEKKTTTYYTIQEDEDISSVKNVLNNAEQDYAGSAICNASVAEEYINQIESILSEATTPQQLWTAYLQLRDKKGALQNSIAAYQAYIDKVAEIKAYVDEHQEELAGTAMDNLNSYLTGTVEPGEQFPNGSYEYIISNCLLTDEEITTEIDYATALHDQAVKSSYQVGAEITPMIVNANLSNGTEGWTIDGNVSVASNLGVSDGAFDMNQQVQGIQKNGIYLLTMDGDNRVNEDGSILNFNSYLYTNDMTNYVAMPGENPEAEAMPTNSILVNVTDGQLKIGVKGMGLANYNLTRVSNFRLYYLGSMDQASSSMDVTLQEMAQHADNMLNNYEYSVDDYYTAPNFSQALRDELTTLTKEQPQTGEEKYNLISKYSDLFQRIRECKTAYAQMMYHVDALYETAYGLASHDFITASELAQYESKIQEIEAGFFEGTITMEEALSYCEWNIQVGIDLPQIDGIYQIGTAKDLAYFCKVTNNGIDNLDAVLTADIDFSEYNMMLGDSSTGYAGTLDGQGHTVTLNISVEDGANYAGFVRTLNGGTLENLILKGNLGCSSLFAGGIVGHSLNNAVIQNVASEVNVSQIGNGNGGVAAFGGFVGHIQNTTIQNVIFAGTLKTAGNSTSGVTGWADGLHMSNCAVIADIEVGDPTQCFADIRGGNSVVENFYYKNLLSGTIAACTQVTEEQILNGELCQMLNSDPDNIVWYQNVGVDAYPLPMKHDGTGINDVQITQSISNDGVYDLQGRRHDSAEKLQRGIYIQRGRKVLVK